MPDIEDDTCGHAKLVDSNVTPYDVSEIAQKSTDTLSDANKIQFLDKCWQPAASSALDTQRFGPKKQITFQKKWLDQGRWLAYSAHDDFKGGCCVPCLLFLKDREKQSLGVFVKTPFRNYNKSKEKLDSHETTEYHKRSIDHAACIRAQMSHIGRRIDTQINTMAMQNFQGNEAILPRIVDAVLLCMKQQIPLRGHGDDRVQFTETPTTNEGNSIVRLLAESNSALKEHFISGPENAWYTSKTVQNEVIGVIADSIHDYFGQCLEKNSHFTLIANEMTSQGREVCRCLHLLDFIADPSNPIKHEVLIDMCDLPRTTESAIACAIRNTLQKHTST